MTHSPLILATRQSPLALTQSRWVAAEMERLNPGLRVELANMTTTGDKMQAQPLPQIGGKGLFTKELEDALLEGRAHLAVHSLKDLPTQLPDGLTLAAVPQREDVRDALISRGGALLRDLPQGARIGTSSIRRAAQLRRVRSDLRIEPLRGNLDTRLRKLKEGPLDAIVLAAAGIHRLGWAEQITEYLAPEILCPAVGQGALGIEACSRDEATLAALAPLEDFRSRLSATAERSLLRRLGGGCQIPIAAHTAFENEPTTAMTLIALVISPAGTQWINAKEQSSELTVAAAEDLGARCAEDLLRQGAQSILQLPA
ncbi:MAG: hydroxymethylbilane synthase [Acidobacteria bacterium]|nr:hydroxymethylbilane synthase [Acidobacteriota bacterium]